MSEGEKLTAVKLLAFIGMLYLGLDAITYFYNTGTGTEINALWGILELAFAIIIFLGLNYWELMPIKLPFNWWILLIFGVVTIIIGFVGSEQSWFTGTIVTMAALIDLFAEKRGWKASKMMALLGAAFGIYDCIIIFMGMAEVTGAGGTVSTGVVLNGVFGLIVAILLIIIIFDFVDIKIPYEWWVLLIFGFVFFWWVTSTATLMAASYTLITGTALVIVGWSGWLLLIAFVLLLLDF
ncbi:MAG: hypothetical protein ACFE9Q_08005 [Candidatus Hodarchaeota archaeon]